MVIELGHKYELDGNIVRLNNIKAANDYNNQIKHIIINYLSKNRIGYWHYIDNKKIKRYRIDIILFNLIILHRLKPVDSYNRKLKIKELFND